MSVDLKFRVQNSELKTGLEQAKTDVRKWQGDVERSTRGGITALKGLLGPVAGLFSAAGLMRMVGESVAYASAITDAAEATRTGIEELQVLYMVARDAGLATERLVMAQSKMAQAPVEAARGNKMLQESFRVLNIDLERFQGMRPEQQLEALGRAYLDAGKSVQAYTALSDILGERAGPKMIEMLVRLGSRGFATARREAEALGLVLDEVAAKRLDKVADSVEQTKTKVSVMINEMIAGLLKAKDVMDKLVLSKPLNEAEKSRTEAEAEALNQLLGEGKVTTDPWSSFSGRKSKVAGKSVDELIRERADSIQAAEARTELERLNNARKAADAREREAREAVKVKEATAVAAAFDEAARKVDYEKLDRMQKVAALQERMGLLVDRAEDPGLELKDRLAAVQEIERAEKEILRLREEQAKADEDQVTKDARATLEKWRKEAEVEKEAADIRKRMRVDPDRLTRIGGFQKEVNLGALSGQPVDMEAVRRRELLQSIDSGIQDIRREALSSKARGDGMATFGGGA